MHVDLEKDKKDTKYVPKDNVFDKMNWEICKSSLLLMCFGAAGANCYRFLDDSERWKNQPITIQLVRPQFEDEELIAVAEVIDEVCNN